VTRRRQFKKLRLRWRGKKSLGWIPFKKVGVKVEGDTVTYYEKVFSFWKSRELPGPVKTGSFSQDARGRWYVNFTCEVAEEALGGTRVIGVDLTVRPEPSRPRRLRSRPARSWPLTVAGS